MSVIQIENITKDYGNHKGVFNVSFEVKEGETTGFLGPNGAGKTTTIRQLLGFIHPQSGSVKINGLDCFKEAATLGKNLGYLPGEISFMEDYSALEFIHFIADLRGVKNLDRANELIEFFDLNTHGKIRKMSKGMKQKVGLVCAFLSSPKILILDEPTSGLDPLMQSRFIELLQQEKKKGTTILLSSHSFEEIEKTCDKAVIIKEGHLVAVEEMEQLKKNRQKIYTMTFEEEKSVLLFLQNHPNASRKDLEVTLPVVGSPNAFLQELCQYSITDLSVRPQSLEELFMHFYGENNHE